MRLKFDGKLGNPYVLTPSKFAKLLMIVLGSKFVEFTNLNRSLTLLA